ncbi:Putative uncharacterized protein [Taphrina deformans PYCC 5710]|uniref:Alkaline phytoceramidase n=1 Tax=Taphrina deformans (strain PYCC 5710 / ATCC 11124 / CBS 356.35 / IMI 108563 / JCM 9778 / NBRC 8474) TaxID=1097556 RepID=R4XB98_TAPDE|nr:Putative uncharacterized protein [Taphrina deformans PYCC 5710]|eukprot:CCG80603.1 Putative uncharacterized protein [Taphrina deformans PYCC 5710]
MINQASHIAASGLAAATEHRSLSFPYVPIPESLYYWGPVTASINWCEEDYVVTKYIAEFCNTTTNAVFVILAAIAIRNAIRYHYERRILLTSFGFMLVGVGKFQLLDELPMIYTTLIMFWGIFDQGLTRKSSIALGGVTVAMGVGITWYYLVNKNPVFHEVAYGLITASVLFKSWHLTATQVKDPVAKADMKYCTITGSVTFLTGFALWGVDRAVCSDLTRARHFMGIPWGFILELHGWWHLLTGTGVALFIIFLTHLRLHLTDRQDDFEMQYTARLWPTLVRKDGYKRVNDHEA